MCCTYIDLNLFGILKAYTSINPIKFLLCIPITRSWTWTCEPRHVNPEVAGSSPALVIFSLFIQIYLENFFAKYYVEILWFRTEIAKIIIQIYLETFFAKYYVKILWFRTEIAQIIMESSLNSNRHIAGRWKAILTESYRKYLLSLFIQIYLETFFAKYYVKILWFRTEIAKIIMESSLNSNRHIAGRWKVILTETYRKYLLKSVVAVP